MVTAVLKKNDLKGREARSAVAARPSRSRRKWLTAAGNGCQMPDCDQKRIVVVLVRALLMRSQLGGGVHVTTMLLASWVLMWGKYAET